MYCVERWSENYRDWIVVGTFSNLADAHDESDFVAVNFNTPTRVMYVD